MPYNKKTPLFKGILAAASLTLALGIVSVLEAAPPAGEPVSYAPASYSAASESKEYTLMIYMVGSDLESASRAASDNLAELERVNTDNINIVVEAGGSYKWHTSGIFPENSTRLHLENNEIVVDSVQPAKNMGLSGTLADFIVYARSGYPSDKVILSLWNHGDGPVGGFGFDELYSGDELSLKELNAALEDAGCGEAPIDIIGFDACCMASVETGIALMPYAGYMLASQEIEPAGGWDYTVMDKLSGLSPGEAAEKIADAYYSKATAVYSAATVSVTDLSRLEPLRGSIEKLAPSLKEGGFEDFSRLRANMKGFGGAGRGGGKSDLVDLHSFFETLNGAGIDTLTAEAELRDTVPFTKSGDTPACGLCIYAPYGELSSAADKLEHYKNAELLPAYAEFSIGFADYILTKQLEWQEPPTAEYDGEFIFAEEDSENVKSVFMSVWEKDDSQEGYYYMTGTDSPITYENGGYKYYIDEEWTFLGGQPLCTLELEGSKGLYTRFACPILLDGERANLVLQYDRENPYGKVLYAVLLNEDGYLSKNVRLLFGQEGLTPLYPVEAFGDSGGETVQDYETAIPGFKAGESIFYDSSMQLEALPAHDSALYGFWFTTYQNKEYFSDFFEAS